MDQATFGLVLRRVRLRRGERQQDVAARAGVSQPTYSEIERGNIEGAPFRTLRRICEALEIRLDLVARWRGGDLDRLVHGRHAAMGVLVAGQLQAAGWSFAPEVSFSVFGERGVIDILAWNADHAALLIVELKTELVDVNELLGTMDRRLRLARGIAQERGWEANTVSGWIVLAESRMNRRHVAAAAPLLRASFPEDGRAVRGWLSRPARRQLALWFLTDNDRTSAMSHLAPRKRVRRHSSRSCELVEVAQQQRDE